MNYEYKFLRLASKKFSPEEIEKQLNDLGKEGWKILNFHPTSDAQIGRDFFYSGVPNDQGYVFVLIREIA